MPAITISIAEEVEVQATTVSINAKCSDLCVTVLLDKDGTEIFEHDGYVPDFMPGDHYGDYVQLDIDLETGQIKNWKAPTAAQLEEWIEAHKD